MNTASGWEKWADWNQRAMQPLTDWLLRAAGLAPGSKLLDVACGAGLPALPAARLVQPGGTVVATDLSPDMVAITERGARAVGLTNMSFKVMNAQELDCPDASVDAVTCAFGLMFCPDPVRAATEMHRVLRPGGRVAIAVWDAFEKNPFFSTVFGPISRFNPAAAPNPDPKGPGMFRLAPPGELESILRAAGFTDIAIESLPMTIEFASVAEHWQCFADVAPPVHVVATTLPAPEVAQAQAAIAAALAPYVNADGRVRLSATALCGSGRK